MTLALCKWTTIGFALFILKVAFGIRQFNFYRTYYIEDYCTFNQGKIIYLVSNGPMASARIRATRNIHVGGNKSCLIIVRSPSNHGIILTVENMEMDYAALDQCRDYIEVYESESNSTKLCGYHGPNDLRAFITDGEMKLMYNTDNSNVFVRGSGFTLFVTAFNHSYTPCPKDNFQCGNGMCIWDGFTCDGINNCGDFSDEEWKGLSQCREFPDFTIKPIDFKWHMVHPTPPSMANDPNSMTSMTTAIFCFLFVFMTILLRVYCYRWNLLNNRNTIAQLSSSPEDETTGRLYSHLGQPPPPYSSIHSVSTQQYSDMVNENPPSYTVAIQDEEDKDTVATACPFRVQTCDMDSKPSEESTFTEGSGQLPSNRQCKDG